MEEAIRIGF